VTLRNAPRATRFDKLATTFADSAKLQAKGRLGSQLTGWRKVIWASIAFLDTSADEAIQLLELHDDIRVVFTDINMPGSMDGLKLAHYVRGRWPPIKLIITSGQRRPLAEDMPAGSGFIAKPYDLEKVAADLRAMIG